MLGNTENESRVPFIRADWPAPAGVHAGTTTRRGPVPEQTFNLAQHVGDNPAPVADNRHRLRHLLDLPADPAWLEQVHGCDVVDAGFDPGRIPKADASVTATPGVVCAVLTADCLPVLICDRDGREVAAVHGGWRGLQQGIIAATLHQLKTSPEHLMAWLGPAISADAYEVDETVREAFLGMDVDSAFRSTRPGHWALDLYAVARAQLHRAGVAAVYGGDCCTFNQPDLFFSYRREKQTGRMASLIWIEPGLRNNH